MSGVTIDGLDAAVGRLGTLAGRIRGGLRAAIADAAERLVGRIRSGPLAGGVLQPRSGRLAASVAASLAEADGVLAAEIGADAPYARFQELGFDGSEAVRAQLRTIRQAFGRAIPARQVAVRAYSRRVDYPPHPFLAPTLAAASGEIARALAAAVAREANP